MAHNFQTSTLSLTLPISCQICLGKVRQPVICANYHVFCSTCMETWLKKARQCPSCRVPITAENPCREIIGGTNESDHSGSHSMRKCLRKTRGELLLREYEDEIESLLTENDELKTKNQSLESQLKTVLDPSSIIVAKSEDKIVDPNFLKELTSKLRAATDVCSKVQQDMEKLKEANKTLRSQNVDLVQENMRLKAEVTSRSPQKFGRYTVAALESKIQQYERDMDHLKRALERSDQYIEDLESQLCDGGRATQPNALVALVSDKAGIDDPIDQQQINMLRRSLSDTERESICSNPEAEVSRTQGLMFTSTALLSDHRGVGERPPRQQNDKESDTASSQLSPSTPSSAFRSLALKSPRIREKKVAFRCASYLRRLSFEDSPNPANCSTSSSSSCCSSISTPEKQVSSVCDFPKGLSLSAQADPSTSVLWGAWQSSKSNDEPCPGPSKELSPRFKEAMSSDVVDMQPDSYQMTSEASMDAAYLDKISELDTMMLDGESSSSRGSQLSLTSSPATDLDNTLVPEPHAPCDMLTGCDVEGGSEVEDNLTLSSPRNQPPCDIDGPPVADTKAVSAEESAGSAEESAGSAEESAGSAEESAGSAEESAATPVSASEGGAQGHSCAEHQMPSHTDELSFDLLFDSLEDEASPSDMQSATDDHRGDSHGSLSSSLADKPGSTRDRQTFVSGQPTKRKSHSPFNANSPTKLSKLVKLVILQPSNP